MMNFSIPGVSTRWFTGRKIERKRPASTLFSERRDRVHRIKCIFLVMMTLLDVDSLANESLVDAR